MTDLKCSSISCIVVKMLNQNLIAQCLAVAGPGSPTSGRLPSGRKRSSKKEEKCIYCSWKWPKTHTHTTKTGVRFLEVWGGILVFLKTCVIFWDVCNFKYICYRGPFCKSTMKKTIRGREETLYPECYVHEASWYFALYPPAVELSLILDLSCRLRLIH